MTPTTRKHYIDNLRWMILLVLIPYHTSMAWNVWGEPNYITFEGNRLLSSIVVFFSPYFMPLLFVLAGVSTKYALLKRTYKEYLVDRGKRLLVPCLFGTIVLMPVMSYIAHRFNYTYKGGFLEHYGVFFTKFTDLTGADGGFSLGQFWFILYLFVISTVALGILILSGKNTPKEEKEIPLWIVCLLGLPLPFLGGILSIGGKSLAEFTYLFMVGYYVFADEKIVSTVEKNCWLLIGIGLVATILNVYLFMWCGKDFATFNIITKYVSEWIMIIALIGVAKRFWNFSGNISNYMNKRSFLFYIYHFIWVVLFQYILYGIIGECTAVFFVGTVILAYVATFVTCEISIRIPFLCFLTGTRYDSKK